MIKIETITEEKDFYNLKDKWNFLLGQSAANNIYLTWEWLYAWWEVYGDSIRNLHILIVKDEKGEIFGIAPLLVRIKKTANLITSRVLEFLGTGEDEEDEVCSNYMDFIVKDGSDEVHERILDYINQGLKKECWDEICLRSVPTLSNTIKYLNNCMHKSLGNKDYPIKISEAVPCAIIKLPEQWEAYLYSIGKKWRNQIRSGRKEIFSKGNIQHELITESDKILKAFEEFIDIHQKRWRDDNKPGLFSSKKFTDFHKKILNLFSHKQWVRIRFLKYDGKAIAASYAFDYDRTIFRYLPAYDRNFEPKIGIGLIERSYDIEDAIKKGYKYYDFYKAKEGSYKWHLAKDKREVQDVFIFKRDFKYYLSTAIRYLKALKGKVKTLCLGNQKV